MKGCFAIIVLVVLVGVFFLPSCEKGRVAGPLSPPLGVTYRDSYIGAGIVMDIANHSDKTLFGVRVHITAKDGRSTDAKVTSALKPGEDKEVGWMELDRWKLEVGEDISIYADGYPAPFITSCSGHRN